MTEQVDRGFLASAAREVSFQRMARCREQAWPQVATRRGIETAVLVPIQEGRRLQDSACPSLKELLLGPGPRFKNLIPERTSFRRRPRTDRRNAE
jgi:hypothetical protein